MVKFWFDGGVFVPRPRSWSLYQPTHTQGRPAAFFVRVWDTVFDHLFGFFSFDWQLDARPAALSGESRAAPPPSL